MDWKRVDFNVNRECTYCWVIKKQTNNVTMITNYISQYTKHLCLFEKKELLSFQILSYCTNTSVQSSWVIYTIKYIQIKQVLNKK